MLTRKSFESRIKIFFKKNKKHIIKDLTIKISYGLFEISFLPTEDFGAKDPSALKAVIAQPKQNVFGEELYPAIYDKASILFEMIINKHCFYNGNKRSAVMGLYVFLRKNGFHLKASDKEIADYVVHVAIQEGKNRLKNEKITKWLEVNSKKMK